jgi:7-cyano-7-deazaguanine synthase
MNASLDENNASIGVLYSGGLDSSILLTYLLRRGCRVQPLYIQSGLIWEPDELTAARHFLRKVATARLQSLVVLSLPLSDLYAGHWSLTGRDVPDATTGDEAVFLPGRNALLIVKAAVWCQLNRVPQLALAPLGTNPFADTTLAFFDHFQAALNQGVETPLRIVRPFEEFDKRDVFRLAEGVPLDTTFSCIAPHDGLHCGCCNKCAERQSAFQRANWEDPTAYDSQPSPSTCAAPVPSPGRPSGG